MSEKTDKHYPPSYRFHAVPSAEEGHLQEFYLERTQHAEEWMSIPWLFYRRLEHHPNQVAVERKISLGDTWRPVTVRELSAEIHAVARGLIGLGLKEGDTVGLLAPNSYEWTLIDMAALTIGVVIVPIYETDSAAQIKWIMKDANIHMAIAQARQSADLLGVVARELGIDCKIYCIATGAMVDIVEAGREVAEAAVEARYSHVNLDTLATIIYTSGTTGRPKGVMVTHRTAVDLALNGLDFMYDVAGHTKVRLLLFLPMAHTLARFVQWYTLAGQGVLGHVPDTHNLLADMASFRPTYLLSVPRVLEKIYNAAEGQTGTGIKRMIFRRAVRCAVEYSKALDTPEGPSRYLRFARNFYNLAFLHKIRDLLGGNCTQMISGGGPLSKRLGHFYRGCGLEILEGYGLTETIGPVSVNTPTQWHIGSVGRPVPSARVRIGDENEIQLKGPSVMKGYWRNPEATREAFTDDGWLKTGDSGWLDSEGYIHVTGRIKEIIVTAGGKNVVPEILEDSLSSHPLISQVVVIGDRRPFIAALITLDKDMLALWLKNHKLPAMDTSDAARHPKVIESLEKAVARANKAVSRAESIRKIKVLSADFTEENGLLTPSLKVKRKQVLRTFSDEINALYGGPLPDEDEDDNDE